MKNKKSLILIFISALMLNVLISGCGQKQEPGQTYDVIISTEYGDLYYPDQWADLINTEQVKAGDTITVSFSTRIDDTSYALFDVTIGGEAGALVGELTDSGGTKRSVYIKTSEIPEDPDLDEGEQNRLYAMQEDLNYLIDNLK